MIEFDETRFTVRDRWASHDDGATWHRADIECDACAALVAAARAAGSLTITAIDHETGTVTVESK